MSFNDEDFINLLEYYCNQDNFHKKSKIPFDNLLVTSGYRGSKRIVSTDSCNEKISLESLFNDERFNKCSKKKKLINKRKGYR